MGLISQQLSGPGSIHLLPMQHKSAIKCMESVSSLKTKGDTVIQEIFSPLMETEFPFPCSQQVLLDLIQKA
jgi:hypothetical protein